MRQTVQVGDYHLDRQGPVEWSLREAAAPHRAFLSDALVEHLVSDARGSGGTAAQIAAVTRLPNTHAVVTTPDTHHGYGSPIGTVYASPSTLSLPVVGNDISCGMAVVLTDLVRSDLEDRTLRQSLLGAMREVIPMGKGMGRDNGDVVADFRRLVSQGIAGLRPNIVEALRLTPNSFEFQQDLSDVHGLWNAIPMDALARGEATLGSLGGGNHFLEIQSLDIVNPAIAKQWGLRPDQIVLMIHSGSRAFGAKIADLYDQRSRRMFEARKYLDEEFRRFVHDRWIERCRAERRQVEHDRFTMEHDFENGVTRIRYLLPDSEAGTITDVHAVRPEVSGTHLTWVMLIALTAEDIALLDPQHLEDDLPFAHRPLPGSGIEPLGGMAGEIAEGYWTAVQAAQNFAVLSRSIMLYRAVQELDKVFGADRVRARHLYDISHNNVQIEAVDGRPLYVHRKGATRAFPANHAVLAGTPWSDTGHPVIVPGSMGAFSYIMRAAPTAARSLYSVNHGAGRAMSRKAATQTLDRAAQQAILDHLDVVTLGATLDEMPDAYKSIDEVVRVCVEGGLTEVVARCHPRAVVKGDDDADD